MPTRAPTLRLVSHGLLAALLLLLGALLQLSCGKGSSKSSTSDSSTTTGSDVSDTTVADTGGADTRASDGGLDTGGDEDLSGGEDAGGGDLMAEDQPTVDASDADALGTPDLQGPAPPSRARFTSGTESMTSDDGSITLRGHFVWTSSESNTSRSTDGSIVLRHTVD